MSRAPSLALAALLWSSMLADARGDVICVNPGGTLGCYATLAQAMNVSGFGDEIVVAAGTYAESVVVYNTKETIRGAGAGATILQGAIHVQLHGKLEMSGFTLQGPGGGSGLVADAESIANVSDCDISGYDYGVTGAEPFVLSLTNCSVHDNNQYGIFVWGDPGDTPPRLTVVRSTISGNATWGIIVDSGSVLARVDDSTISGNGNSGIEATGAAGAGRLRIRVRRSTIAGNARGIVDGTPPEVLLRVHLESTIVADSTAGPDVIGPDMTLVSRGYNVIEALDPATTLGGSSADLIGVDPALGPLQDNGGPTKTQAPLAGSPAIDLIPKTARCRHPDQRSDSRLPAPCDAGAYGTP